jgi:hypothetical protein
MSKASDADIVIKAQGVWVSLTVLVGVCRLLIG